jgi:hypothetical protein
LAELMSGVDDKVKSEATAIKLLQLRYLELEKQTLGQLCGKL